MIYTVSVFLVKLSILLLYQRFFGVYNILRRLIICGYAAIIFIIIGTLTNSIARLELCTSVEKTMKERFCFGVNINISVLASAILNTFADFYILAIPVGRILKMHVTTKRIGLLIIFLTGLV